MARTNTGGRPRKYDRAAVAQAIEQYIEKTQIPIIAEFCYKNGFGKETLHNWPEFENLIKVCLAKKESALEHNALKGDINCSMAIFSLKQLGWSDKIDQTHKGDAANPVAFTEVQRRL